MNIQNQSASGTCADMRVPCARQLRTLRVPPGRDRLLTLSLSRSYVQFPLHSLKGTILSYHESLRRILPPVRGGAPFPYLSPSTGFSRAVSVLWIFYPSILYLWFALAPSKIDTVGAATPPAVVYRCNEIICVCVCPWCKAFKMEVEKILQVYRWLRRPPA